MEKELIANASIAVKAPIMHVWEALITPDIIKKYMFGTDVVSSWKEGDPISWKGEWEGKPYEDKGKILKFDPGKMLRYSHYSPSSGLPDSPENYHTVTYILRAENGRTVVSLSQDNNKDEKEVEHSKKMWQSMLEALKKEVETNYMVAAYN
jgi:uncharacterized protein YndB with AHSA1/START domain